MNLTQEEVDSMLQELRESMASESLSLLQQSGHDKILQNQPVNTDSRQKKVNQNKQEINDNKIEESPFEQLSSLYNNLTDNKNTFIKNKSIAQKTRIDMCSQDISKNLMSKKEEQNNEEKSAFWQ